MINRVVEYLKEDQSRRYSLLEEVEFSLVGNGIGRIAYSNDVISIAYDTPEHCAIIIQPFEASTGYWNGPDILPDNLKDGSFEASLVHDLIWTFSKEIAQANHITEQEVLKWSNGVMIAIMRAYQKGKEKKFWNRLVYSTLETGRRIYKPMKKLLKTIFLVVAVCGLCHIVAGCMTPPLWHGEDSPTLVYERG